MSATLAGGRRLRFPRIKDGFWKFTPLVTKLTNRLIITIISSSPFACTSSQYTIFVKPKVTQATFEKDVLECFDEGERARREVLVPGQPGIIGSGAAGLLEGYQKSKTERETRWNCLAQKGYRRETLAADPAARFGELTNEQKRRLYAHIASGHNAETFKP